jgi:hypothetical protein
MEEEPQPAPRDSRLSEDIDREYGAVILQRNMRDLEVEGFRAMREAVLELLPESSPARIRLKAIDDSIAAQRERLRGLSQG